MAKTLISMKLIAVALLLAGTGVLGEGGLKVQAQGIGGRKAAGARMSAVAPPKPYGVLPSPRQLAWH